MTTTSHTRLKPHFRLASMESLGFLETPFDSSSSSRAIAPPAVPADSPPVKVGRHVQSSRDNNKVESTALIDWKPQETAARLNKRDFRWTALFLAALLISGSAVLGYWLYQRPTQEATGAIESATANAAQLSNALQAVAALAVDLADGNLPEDYSSVLSESENLARDLFTSSAAIPPSDATFRALAADSAGKALDASKRLSSAILFRATLESNLVMPQLETDPGLIDLATATSQFGDWRAHLDELAANLPEGVDSDLVTAFENFRASLVVYQSSYVDGIDGDGSAAEAALRTIDSDLSRLRQTFDLTFATLSTELAAEIGAVRSDLARLVG